MAFKNPLPFLLSLCFLPSLIYSEVGFIEPWGKDAPLSQKQMHLKAPDIRSDTASYAAEKVIRFHQTFLSPLSGPRSHFRPTSSRYMQMAIRRFGFFKGFLMGCDRLLRENGDPWVYRMKEIDNVLYKWDPTSERP